MFDGLIREAGTHYGLGDRARPFLGHLLVLLFPAPDDGPDLRARFAARGMDALFAGWIGSRPLPHVLAPDRFEAVLGPGRIQAIADDLQLPPATVRLAGAALLPPLVALLSSGGRFPAAPPAEATALIGEVRPGARVHPLPPPPDPAAAGSGGLKWGVLAVLCLLAVLLVRACQYRPAAAAVLPLAGGE